MQMNFRSSACILFIMLCLNVKTEVRGQEAIAHKTFSPKLVSDDPPPKPVVLLLNALGATIHPQVEIDQATKEAIVGFVEGTLKGLHLKDLRVEKPILLLPPTKTSYESSGDSSLKMICVLLKRAGLHFSIRENNTFVFEPISDSCVEYNVQFVGYTDGQEIFKVTKRR